LESGEGFRSAFFFEKRAFPFSCLTVVDYEFQVGTVAVGVLADFDFALSHGHIVATWLPRKQVNSRYYAFFYVTMIDARKAVFSLAKWPFQSVKADVAKW